VVAFAQRLEEHGFDLVVHRVALDDVLDVLFRAQSCNAVEDQRILEQARAVRRGIVLRIACENGGARADGLRGVMQAKRLLARRQFALRRDRFRLRFARGRRILGIGLLPTREGTRFFGLFLPLARRPVFFDDAMVLLGHVVAGQPLLRPLLERNAVDAAILRPVLVFHRPFGVGGRERDRIGKVRIEWGQANLLRRQSQMLEFGFAVHVVCTALHRSRIR
jgi:hypothetical protein